MSKVKCVQVVFSSGGREYTYKTSNDIKANQLVVVKVENEYRLTVAASDSVMMNPMMEIKTIVAVVDTTEYEAQEALDAWRLEELKALTRIAKARMARKTMRDMFADDPELLARYEAITSATQVLE